MKLSTRSTYAMRALVELGLAYGRGPLSAAFIAGRQDLSVAYLEQLLHRLKKHGIISSVRGPKGGYALTREPERIAMGEIVRVLDGADELSVDHRADAAHRHAQMIAHAVFRRVHEHLVDALDHVTLKDLCDEVRDISGEPLDHRYVFHI